MQIIIIVIDYTDYNIKTSMSLAEAGQQIWQTTEPKPVPDTFAGHTLKDSCCIQMNINARICSI